jgi:hypothetical protein
MRGSTKICFQFESVGRPEHTLEGRDQPLNECIRQLASWLLAVPMGHKIRVLIGRDMADLKDRRSAAKLELMDELESLLGGTPENEESTDGHS